MVAVRRNAGTQRGFTLYEFLVLSSIMLLIVALATPGMIREYKRVQNEAAVIANLRAIAASQSAYASTCGAGAYAVGLPTVKQAGIPFADQQHGYNFALRPTERATTRAVDCRGLPSHKNYVITAQPVSYNVTGARSFAMTDEHVIWEMPGASAPAEPFAEPAVQLR